MSSVIKAENISKRYILDHQGSERYVALRDVIASKVKNTFKTGTKASDKEEFWALRDLNFEIKQGDRVGIVGRNGAGKSTLLKILSRITEPTTGKIGIKGRIASLLEVGTGFHPELTGRENIYLNGAILGMRKHEISRKFDEIVSFAEVERFLDTPVKRYSSGMYVRLAFAVAAHLEPEILIVDEVLAVGDAQFQKKCLGRMNEVGKEGRTVLFVSHSMQAIKGLCNRGILLSAGTTEGVTDVDSVVRSYLGSAKANSDFNSIREIIRKLPQDPVFSLKHVGLTQDDEPVGDFVENGKSLNLIIEYEVKKTSPGLRVYFDLIDDQENLILRSFNDELGDGMSIVKPGHYRNVVTIPKDFLSPINYTIKVQATIYNERYLIPGSIDLSFDVERTGTSNRAYPTEPIRGKIAPSFNWSIQETV